MVYKSGGTEDRWREAHEQLEQDLLQQGQTVNSVVQNITEILGRDRFQCRGLILDGNDQTITIQYDYHILEKEKEQIIAIFPPHIRNKILIRPLTEMKGEHEVRMIREILKAAWWCEHKDECPDIKANCSRCRYFPGATYRKCCECDSLVYTNLAFRAAEVDYAKGMRFNRAPWPD